MTQEKTVEKKLSRAAIETLAIIVYHQPVTRAEIEEIRCCLWTNTLEILMELNWVKPGGRRGSRKTYSIYNYGWFFKSF